MSEKIKIFFFVVLITIITLETGVYFLNKFDVIRVYTPSYQINQPFWSDINKIFGVWHVKNSEFTHYSPCFNVDYSSNSHGMRDSERDEKYLGRRFLVLGDSFVEGFGVHRKERFTNLLEKDTGYEFLNFGTSGIFGLTQSALLYESLADKFDHTDLIISVLPFNDFSDDDIDYGKVYYSDRYRPYLVGKYPNYNIEYLKPNIDSGRNEEKVHRKIMSFFREFTYTYNFMVMIRDRFFVSLDADDLLNLNNIKKEVYGNDWSGYYDVDNDQLNRMFWSLNKISKIAHKSDRNIYLFIVPTKHDIKRLELNSRKSLSKLQSYFEKTLPLLGVEYIPMTEKFVEKSKNMKNISMYYHTCDDHWNDTGNALAKDVIKDFIF